MSAGQAGEGWASYCGVLGRHRVDGCDDEEHRACGAGGPAAGDGGARTAVWVLAGMGATAVVLKLFPWLLGL